MIAGCESFEVHVVRQLIHVCCRVKRKVSSQLFADFFDSFEEPGGEVTVPEMLGHSIGNPLPEVLADFRVNPLVSKDDEAST